MKKVLVAYFSASGVTKRAAERLAKGTGADLFEIQPEKPYTDADLDWEDKKSRSTLEMQDRNCRPEISGKVADMGQYGTVFVGFPIWWYREPSIIDTFMESYDFSGKKIIPFATSGGSGMGESGKNLSRLAPGAKAEAGRCFPAGVTEEEIGRWGKERM